MLEQAVNDIGLSGREYNFVRLVCDSRINNYTTEYSLVSLPDGKLVVGSALQHLLKPSNAILHHHVRVKG